MSDKHPMRTCEPASWLKFLSTQSLIVVAFLIAGCVAPPLIAPTALPTSVANQLPSAEPISNILELGERTQALPTPSIAPPAAFVAPSAYADEPFPVRIVNRARFDERFRPARVPNTMGEAPGTIVIDTRARLLYFVAAKDEALRYGIAVGGPPDAWRGTAVIGRKQEWPTWYPTDQMRKHAPGIPRAIPPGADNPLGARALYMYQNGRDTLIRIHGTAAPWTIGTDGSSGCFRMINEDIIELYEKVSVGARVVVW
jgi:lipoprotein-anchoring transpeptidase ErfK/SrfK